MDEIEFNSELDSLIGIGASHSSNEALKNGLDQVQVRAEESQRQQDLLMAKNNQIRSKLEALRKKIDSDQEDKNKSKELFNDEILRSEVEILRTELQQLRTQANQDRDQIQELPKITEADNVSREIELQAALQAERQQAALMRKALEERDKALEELTNQCQTLEDDLEDREREMDHLNRQIEQVQSDSSKAEALEIAMDKTLSMGSQRASLISSDISELFQPDPVSHSKKFSIPWKKIGKAVSIVLGIGVIGIITIIAWPHIHKTFTQFTSKPTINTVSLETPSPINEIKPKDTTTTLPEAVSPKIAVVPPVLTNLQQIRDRLKNGEQGPKMIQIPAGQFFMGTKPLYGGGTELNEQPYHQVSIKSFFIASYETTFEEYERFAHANNYPLPDDAGFGRDNRPVININWQEAQQYVEWLSKETGFKYYLPSEAQWEYAARSGTITRYWWGNTIKHGQAVCFACGTSWDSLSTAPVGSLTANAFGIYDTAGNVMEWLQDCYNENYTGAPNDGSPWLTGDCNQRLVRGGAFNKPMSSTRSSARFRLPVESRFNTLGFRVARD